MEGGEVIHQLLVDDSIVSDMHYSLSINVSNDISSTNTSLNFSKLLNFKLLNFKLLNLANDINFSKFTELQ